MITTITSRRTVLGMAAMIVASMVAKRRAVADDGPIAPVHQLIAGLLQVMKAGHGKPFSQRFDMLAPVIDKTFDLETILRESVGSSWGAMPQDQQESLLKSFRRYTIASYVNSFDDYNGQRFQVNPETRSVGNDEIVRTQIVPVAGDGHELDYVMRQTPAGWRVVDVLADGAVSRVAVQRSDFRSVIRQGGAPALAERLDAKSSVLAG